MGLLGKLFGLGAGGGPPIIKDQHPVMRGRNRGGRQTNVTDAAWQRKQWREQARAAGAGAKDAEPIEAFERDGRLSSFAGRTQIAFAEWRGRETIKTFPQVHAQLPRGEAVVFTVIGKTPERREERGRTAVVVRRRGRTMDPERRAYYTDDAKVRAEDRKADREEGELVRAATKRYVVGYSYGDGWIFRGAILSAAQWTKAEAEREAMSIAEMWYTRDAREAERRGAIPGGLKGLLSGVERRRRK
jgi:hypothetical protein